jgi:hypothetical protein
MKGMLMDRRRGVLSKRRVAGAAQGARYGWLLTAPASGAYSVAPTPGQDAGPYDFGDTANVSD